MDDTDQKIMGLLTGGLTTAAVHYVRTQDNLERRLDRTDDRARDAQDGLNTWLNSGTVARLIKQTVQDVLGGIAAASPAPQTPTAVPTTTNITRPDISGMNTATETNWPPVAGIYNEQANIVQVGELARFGLALTYQEVRTAILALVQATPPTLGGKVQIYNVINALIQSVLSRSATLDQYRTGWDAFFNGFVQNGDPHKDPTKIPQASALGGDVSSVVPLAGSTDEVARFRIKAGPGNLTAGVNPVFTVSYATPYPVFPIVLPENGLTISWAVGAIGQNTYQVFLTSGSINSGQTYDLKILSLPGIRL